MLLIALVVVTLVCAVGPALLFVSNLKKYTAPDGGDGTPAAVAVLVPARNEEENIAGCLECVLLSSGVELEVLVFDDASTDGTARIVREIAARDERVRLLSSGQLPSGWNGKQHACWQLAQASTSPLMLFLDADVRLASPAVAACAAERQRRNVALLSGFPRLITVGPMEWLLLPLVHFVLLGFLPLERMRLSTEPAFAAGCGQFMLAEREAYFASGGHEAIRATMHDGLLLPRALRRAGFRTDIVDLTGLAQVRMYDSARKVWQGLAKNATEGIGKAKRIAPITLMLFLGQIAPLLLFVFFLASLRGFVHHSSGRAGVPVWAIIFTGASLFASYLPRLLAVRRFRQPFKSALLHPVGMALLLCVQWYALARQIAGRPIGWRQREYASGAAGEVPR